jgi:hypothetical protein
VLITRDGDRILTHALARRVDGIEAEMAQRRAKSSRDASR